MLLYLFYYIKMSDFIQTFVSDGLWHLSPFHPLVSKSSSLNFSTRPFLEMHFRSRVSPHLSVHICNTLQDRRVQICTVCVTLDGLSQGWDVGGGNTMHSHLGNWVSSFDWSNPSPDYFSSSSHHCLSSGVCIFPTYATFINLLTQLYCWVHIWGLPSVRTRMPAVINPRHMQLL